MLFVGKGEPSDLQRRGHIEGGGYQRFKCAWNDVVVVPKSRVLLKIGVILAYVLPNQCHAKREGVRLILLVILGHMVGAWMGRVDVPDDLSTCVEKDSPTPGLNDSEGRRRVLSQISRMCYGKVEDEVASMQRSVGGLEGTIGLDFEMGLDRRDFGRVRDYWCEIECYRDWCR